MFRIVLSIIIWKMKESNTRFHSFITDLDKSQKFGQCESVLIKVQLGDCRQISAKYCFGLPNVLSRVQSRGVDKWFLALCVAVRIRPGIVLSQHFGFVIFLSVDSFKIRNRNAFFRLMDKGCHFPSSNIIVFPFWMLGCFFS